MNCINYSGLQPSRDMIREYEWYFTNTNVPKFQVMLTTYEIAMSDITYLKRFNYGLLVVDEVNYFHSHTHSC